MFRRLEILIASQTIVFIENLYYNELQPNNPGNAHRDRSRLKAKAKSNDKAVQRIGDHRLNKRSPESERRAKWQRGYAVLEILSALCGDRFFIIGDTKMTLHKTESLTIRLDPETKVQLLKIARATGRSRGGLLRHLIRSTEKPEAQKILGMPLLEVSKDEPN